MTQQERDARSERFQAFASRMQGAFAFAGRSHFEQSGRGAVVVNAAELPGGGGGAAGSNRPSLRCCSSCLSATICTSFSGAGSGGSACPGGLLA